MTMTELHLPDAGYRYAAINFDEWMQAVCDEVAELIAEHITATSDDYQNLAYEVLPFKAWEIHAVNYTEVLGEQIARDGLDVADQLNELAGTEEGWFVLCRSLGMGANWEDVEGGTPNRVVGAELFIIPPTTLAVNAELLSHLGKVARIQTVPYWLRIVSINVINRMLADVYIYAVIRPYAYGVFRGEEV